MKYIEEKYKGKITDFTFRHKVQEKNGKWNSRNVKIKVSDKELVMNSSEDKYLKGYHSVLFYRPSC